MIQTSKSFLKKSLQRIKEIANYSEDESFIFRPSFSPSMRSVHRLVSSWMKSSGMIVGEDELGNLIGRYEGTESQETYVLGSHLDTVPNAGNYDGVLGIVIALGCVEELHRRGIKLPYAIEVVCFADEEGARFHTAFLGSKYYTHQLPPEYLDYTDKNGISLKEALKEYNKNPAKLKNRNQGKKLIGYLEVHIEQGPILENKNLPVGVASTISGQSRISVKIEGEPGHAGTVPMALRKDALSASAEIVLYVERMAQLSDDVVATVGFLEILAGASNIIPGKTEFTLDIRSAVDRSRRDFVSQVKTEIKRICLKRGVLYDWRVVQESNAVRCSASQRKKLLKHISLCGEKPLELVSGAGHDAMQFSKLCPTVMLLVRCKGGVSHSPEEFVKPEDIQVAGNVLLSYLSATLKAK